MTLQETEFQGLFLIKPPVFKDLRGVFIKIYNSDDFKRFGLNLEWHEDICSVSHKNVIRGMHFQVPPVEHIKFVRCLKGAILDVVVDIRKSSPTFGKVFSVELNDENNLMLYIPQGFAHGLLSLADNSTISYKVSSVYDKECDMGIKWSGIDFTWPVSNPIISERDSEHPDLVNFSSPF